jgi:hypothetical protein
MTSRAVTLVAYYLDRNSIFEIKKTAASYATVQK